MFLKRLRRRFCQVPVLILSPQPQPTFWPFFGNANRSVEEFKRCYSTRESRLVDLARTLRMSRKSLVQHQDAVSHLQRDIHWLERAIRICGIEPDNEWVKRNLKDVI